MPGAVAQAQDFTWSGPGSTTASSDYKLGTNWGNPPAGAPPVAAGQSAVFATTGQATVFVSADPIVPNSWTFNSNAQSYSIQGGNVNFSLAGASGGIINNANADQRISSNIGEAVAGVQIQQLGNGALTLSGNNTYSGGTIITAGAIKVTDNHSVGTGTVTLNGGTFMFDTGVSGFGFFNEFKINAAGGTIDNNGGFLSIAGNITNGVGNTGVLQISDSTGSGITDLAGSNNAYSGGTRVIGTTVQVRYGSAVGTGLVTLEDARFMASDNVPDGSLSFSNNFAINDTPSGSVIESTAGR
jgi:autotransporter-associated beta strand protein